MRTKGQIDYLIFIVVFLLTIFGLMILASASSDLGKTRFNDAYYYLRHQIIYGLSIGLVGWLVGFFIPYRYYKKIATFLLLVTVVLVALAFTPLGFSAQTEAARWLNLGPITFQPSELLKITFIIYLAAWLSRARSNRDNNFWEGFVPFLTVCGVISLLLLLSRSTSSAIIIMSSALAVYFTSGAKKSYILYAILLGSLVLGLFIALTPYRLERFITYLNPHHDLEGSSYQVNKALVAIGSGGLWGVGYGKSIAKTYLPERIGDSIFAVIGEELGFVGSVALLTAFFSVVLRTYQLAKHIGDRFGKSLLVGFGTIIGVQVFIHAGSNLGIIPLTGVPLPFISYGGTALAVFLTMTGIMLNISKQA